MLISFWLCLFIIKLYCNDVFKLLILSFSVFFSIFSFVIFSINNFFGIFQVLHFYSSRETIAYAW